MTMPFGNASSFATSRASPSGADERDLAGCSAAREHIVELGEVEVDRVHIDVGTPVDSDLVPPVRRDVAEVGVSDARPVGLDPDQLRAGD